MSVGLVWRKGIGQKTVCVESGVKSEPGVFEEHREASGAEVEGAGHGEVEEKFNCYWGHVGKGFESHHSELGSRGRNNRAKESVNFFECAT